MTTALDIHLLHCDHLCDPDIASILCSNKQFSMYLSFPAIPLEQEKAWNDKHVCRAVLPLNWVVPLMHFINVG